MRGKENKPIYVACDYRITPAYAGKSGRVLTLARFSEDHPRVCGEKFPKWAPITLLMGSPPRMRGKVWDNFKHFMGEGITPAYAGKRTLFTR